MFRKLKRGLKRNAHHEKTVSINRPHEFFIQWHLTDRCNLRCIHCYQTARNMDEMSLSETKLFTDEVSDMLKAWEEAYKISISGSFNVTGGEPFLRHDLFEILRQIKGHGFDIYLLTNGILITKEKAGMLPRLGVKGVQVSIEGPREIHETIRGKDSFAASLKGVKYLLDAGIVVTLNVTVSQVNAGHFMEIIGLAESLGVQRLGFSRLVPSGRGAGMLNKMLTKKKVGELYEKIFSQDIKGLEIVTGDPVASQMSDSDDSDRGLVATGGCAAGVSGLTVLPDGTVTPCRRLHIPIGNIRKDSLREIWAGSDVLASLRNKSAYKGKCGQCPKWAVCRGCRAIAYAYSVSQGKNNFLSEDPQCFIGE